jgi:hypothetical protein
MSTPSQARLAVAAICDLTGTIRARVEARPDFRLTDPVSALVDVIAELRAETGVPAERLRHVQLGVSGSYDPHTTMRCYSAHWTPADRRPRSVDNRNPQPDKTLARTPKQRPRRTRPAFVAQLGEGQTQSGAGYATDRKSRCELAAASGVAYRRSRISSSAAAASTIAATSGITPPTRA